MEKKINQSSDEIQGLWNQLEQYKKTCIVLRENNEQIHEKLETKIAENSNLKELVESLKT